jgi:hypothetical protein
MSRIPKNETPNSMFIKKMVDKTPTTAAPVVCNRHTQQVVDRIGDFLAAKVDLNWRDKPVDHGRPAGSRVIQDKFGKFILVTK